MRDRGVWRGCAATAFGTALSADDPLSDVVDFLRDKRVLIVLDNCEQVTAGWLPKRAPGASQWCCTVQCGPAMASGTAKGGQPASPDPGDRLVGQGPRPADPRGGAKHRGKRNASIPRLRLEHDAKIR